VIVHNIVRGAPCELSEQATTAEYAHRFNRVLWLDPHSPHAIEFHTLKANYERLSTLAAELVRLKVDVIVTAPAGSASFAKKVTSTIPIVFIGEPDPVK
jgi:phosphoribosylpyrophosphate synthetase